MNYFRYKQFNKNVITVAVGYYLRYALSYRDISEILRERGVNVYHSTVYRWVQEYAPILYQIWNKKNKKAYDKWRIDETYIKIKGKWNYLYRAIDAEGHTLNNLVNLKRSLQIRHLQRRSQWLKSLKLLNLNLTIIVHRNI